MSQSRVSEPGFPLSLASIFSFAVVVAVLLVGLALMDRWTFFMVVARDWHPRTRNVVDHP